MSRNVKRSAKAWLSGWNDRDLERIVSPLRRRGISVPVRRPSVGRSSRTIKGQRDLTHYFERRAGGGSSIEFEFLGVFHGVDTLVLHFQSKTHKCAEFMELNPEGKVRRSMPTFGPEKRMCGATRVAPRWRVPEYF
jgi:hypothetical protein